MQGLNEVVEAYFRQKEQELETIENKEEKAAMRRALDAEYEKAGYKRVRQTIASKRGMYGFSDWYNPARESEEEARKRFRKQHSEEVSRREEEISRREEEVSRRDEHARFFAQQMAHIQPSEHEMNTIMQKLLSRDNVLGVRVEALLKQAKTDKNGLSTEDIVENLMTIAAEEPGSVKVKALNGVSRVIDNVQSDKQLAAVVGGLDKSSYLMSEDGMEGRMPDYLRRCMESKEFGPRAMTAMAAVLASNQNMDNDVRGEMLGQLSAKFEQNKDKMPAMYRERIAGSLRRSQKRFGTLRENAPSQGRLQASTGAFPLRHVNGPAEVLHHIRNGMKRLRDLRFGVNRNLSGNEPRRQVRPGQEQSRNMPQRGFQRGGRE